MKQFYLLLGNMLLASVTNTFVWFALIFWLYLETKSVLATSIMTGIYLVTVALSGFWFGSIVDHNKKKVAMLVSSISTLVLFSAGFCVYFFTPSELFQSINNAHVWILVFLILAGVIAGNIRNIALPTTTTFLVAEDQRDKANGMAGMVMGISFSVSSIASGFILSLAGFTWVLLIGLLLTALTIIHLLMIRIPEKDLVFTEEKPKKLDIAGTIAVLRSIPGIFSLIFFTTFNNFLGGVFMPLMDPYGLSLVSLQTWGVLWGFLSLGFIFGGLYISKYGLGKKPLQTLFRINIVMWIVCIFFAIQPSIILLSVGMLIWISIVPFIEATEHTVIQKIVPPERQGRVFGFAQSVESTASPLTAFLIGPIAQFIFIPFMTNGKGVNLIGSWFETGPGRGIALVFIATGIVGLCVTLIAMRSRAYHVLSKAYQNGSAADGDVAA